MMKYWFLKLWKSSLSHSGVASGSRGPWLSWETVISPRRIGAGEDGRVFRSGKSLIDSLHYLYPHTHTHLHGSFSCTVCSWLLRLVMWLRGGATPQPGLVQCMLGLRPWGGAGLCVWLCLFLIYLHVFVHWCALCMHVCCGVMWFSSKCRGLNKK